MAPGRINDWIAEIAEIAGEYLRKGSQVYVEGSIRTRKYTDKDDVEKHATDIRADTRHMLGERAKAAPSASCGAALNASSAFDDIDDDVPF